LEPLEGAAATPRDLVVAFVALDFAFKVAVPPPPFFFAMVVNPLREPRFSRGVKSEWAVVSRGTIARRRIALDRPEPSAWEGEQYRNRGFPVNLPGSQAGRERGQ
jgi:hypothetical protein